MNLDIAKPSLSQSRATATTETLNSSPQAHQPAPSQTCSKPPSHSNPLTRPPMQSIVLKISSEATHTFSSLGPSQPPKPSVCLRR